MRWRSWLTSVWNCCFDMALLIITKNGREVKMARFALAGTEVMMFLKSCAFKTARDVEQRQRCTTDSQMRGRLVVGRGFPNSLPGRTALLSAKGVYRSRSGLGGGLDCSRD